MLESLIVLMSCIAALAVAAKRCGVGRREHEPRVTKLLGPGPKRCVDRRDIDPHEHLYMSVWRLGESEPKWRCVTCGLWDGERMHARWSRDVPMPDPPQKRRD